MDDSAVTLSLLKLGSMETEGLLPWSSNYSFLVSICANTAVSNAIGETETANLKDVRAVYKPRRGERPLWDFSPGSLYKREQAAFVVSHALEWHQVPPTVVRDGSHGTGSVQLFVDHDPECHYFTFEGSEPLQEQLQKIVLFDMIINNADRKAGHVLIEDVAEPVSPDRLWLIDHGVCFHSEDKLRTVIWEFAGHPIPELLLANIQCFSQLLADPTSPLYQEMNQLLSSRELIALQQRTQQVLSQCTFSTPGPGRHYPWPPV